jgi:tRNA G37 N-methylase Trm5
MTRSKHLHKAKELWQNLVQANDIIIDATSGNGHDTLFLAELLKTGKIYALDIQPQALENTKAKLEKSTLTCAVEYICGSHATFPSNIAPNTVRLIVYNLGYLPGGDKTLTTETSSTLTSLQNDLPLLTKGGALSIMLYPGHEEGEKEANAVLAFANNLPKSEWNVEHLIWGDNPKSPSLLWVGNRI